jgi:hypothetical protein
VIPARSAPWMTCTTSTRSGERAAKAAEVTVRRNDLEGKNRQYREMLSEVQKLRQAKGRGATVHNFDWSEPRDLLEVLVAGADDDLPQTQLVLVSPPGPAPVLESAAEIRELIRQTQERVRDERSAEEWQKSGFWQQMRGSPT